MDKPTIKSSHIFILPFKIINEDMNSKVNREEHIFLKKDDWIDYDYIKNKEINNNDALLKYLNKYAKDSLFKYGNNDNDRYVHEFHNKTFKKRTDEIKKNTYVIKVKDKYETKYILEIENIIVKFFDTSIGTISFFLNNYDYPNIEDVLNINNYGRKLYLAYQGDTDVCFQIKKEEDIVVDYSLSEVTLNFGNIENLKGNKIIDYFFNSKKIEIMLDDRMYVMSDYYESREIDRPDKSDWYKYVFIDSADSKTCQDDEMEDRLLKKATYNRWKKFGTFIGISRYSFVIWRRGTDFLNSHLKMHYFQMISIALAQELSLILLNEKLNDLLIDSKSGDGWENGYEEYLTYTTKLNFSIVTSQEQGIELFKICQTQMSIKLLTDEVDKKMGLLYQMAERYSDDRFEELQKKRDKVIVTFGACLTALEVLFGYFGMDSTYINNFPDILRPDRYMLEKVLFILLITLICVVILRSWTNSNDK